MMMFLSVMASAFADSASTLVAVAIDEIKVSPVYLRCLDAAPGQWSDLCDDAEAQKIVRFREQLAAAEMALRRHSDTGRELMVHVEVGGKADGLAFPDGTRSAIVVKDELRRRGLLFGMAVDPNNGSANDELACLRGVVAAEPFTVDVSGPARVIVEGICTVHSEIGPSYRGATLRAFVAIEARVREVATLASWAKEQGFAFYSENA